MATAGAVSSTARAWAVRVPLPSCTSVGSSGGSTGPAKCTRVLQADCLTESWRLPSGIRRPSQQQLWSLSAEPWLLRGPHRRCSRAFCAGVSAEVLPRFAFRTPDNIVEMPAVASADPALMGLRRLIRHMHEAVFVWRILHPPFWEAAFSRLRELRGEIKSADAARLIAIFRHLRLVDLEVVDACERVFTGDQGTFLRQTVVHDGDADSAVQCDEGDEGDVDDEVTGAAAAAAAALLELRSPDLAEAAEALVFMKRPHAAAAALRPLASRAHRLEPALIMRMLTVARHAQPSGTAADFSDAAARALVERESVSMAVLSKAAEALATLALEDRCRTGSRSGAERLFQHISRRLRQKEGQQLNAAIADRILLSAESMGLATPAFARLLTESRICKSEPETGHLAAAASTPVPAE